MTKIPISVAIISNVSNDQFIDIILSIGDAVDEICIGGNGPNFDKDLIEKRTAHLKNVNIYILEWVGYGKTKNNLQNLCKNDWILSIDSDENLSSELKNFIQSFSSSNPKAIYAFKRNNYIGLSHIRFGLWGKDNAYVSRLFNRKNTRWNTLHVHEELEFDTNSTTIIKVRDTPILHYTAKNLNEVRQKNAHYALLSAQMKFEKGATATFLKKYISAAYTFIKSYFILYGILDGKLGFKLAIEQAIYSYQKYHILHSLTEQKTTN